METGLQAWGVASTVGRTLAGLQGRACGRLAVRGRSIWLCFSPVICTLLC